MEGAVLVMSPRSDRQLTTVLSRLQPLTPPRSGCLGPFPVRDRGRPGARAHVRCAAGLSGFHSWTKVWRSVVFEIFSVSKRLLFQKTFRHAEKLHRVGAPVSLPLHSVPVILLLPGCAAFVRSDRVAHLLSTDTLC